MLKCQEATAAPSDRIRGMAVQQLADLDARTPNRLFDQPQRLTLADAYALQREVNRLREERGERSIGYKIGCTSPVIRRQLGIREPIYGELFDTGQLRSGARISHAAYASLAIEGELALRLAKDLPDQPLSDRDYLNSIGGVFPVIELHHYVRRSARSFSRELIASNGMHAGFVAPDALEGKPGVQVERLTILIDGKQVDLGEPWTMGGAVEAVRWLAGRLRETGRSLSRGQIILTGSPMRLHPVAAGSRIVVEAPPIGATCVVVDP